jgi:hypothetical protein
MKEYKKNRPMINSEGRNRQHENEIKAGRTKKYYDCKCRGQGSPNAMLCKVRKERGDFEEQTKGTY